MTEIIIFEPSMKHVIETWQWLGEKAIKETETKIVRYPPQIITKHCRIRFRSIGQRNEGLRADITLPFDPEIMSHSRFGQEHCTLSTVFELLKQVAGQRKEI